MKSIKISAFILIMFLINAGLSQQMAPNNRINCFTDMPAAMCYDNSFLGGQCKPESIERYTSDPDAVYRILVVYVQLQNDPYPDVTHWLRGQAPTYMNTLLSSQKQSSSDWWNAYNETTSRISDYWMEVSRGKFHVIGKEVNIILPQDNDWYINNGGSARAMDDIYDALAANTDINWPLYDKWEKSGSNFIYGSGDGFIDMIYFVFRSQTNIIGIPNARMSDCSHGDHIIYNVGGVVKKIRTEYSQFGSGFQIAGFGQPLNAEYITSFMGHEHGHYMLGVRDGWHAGHQGYGKINNYFGMEEFYSPYELIRPGYFQTKKVNYGSTPIYYLDDWSSRNTNPYNDPDEILEVPIGDVNRNEFFLIVNRQKESTYDIVMWGDDARGDPYTHNSSADKGKGIYIYHAYPGAVGQGYVWQVPFDLECADGLWNWQYVNDIHPDWSCTQFVPYYKRTVPIYFTNDNTDFNLLGQTTGLEAKDGKSMNYHWNENGNMVIYKSWFGLGDTPPCEQGYGKDRIETNLIESVPYPYQYPYKKWTSREHQGDRWDAWKVGYNEVFSPYSSPSTANWDNQSSGIFIYLESMNGLRANFKIYKVGESGLTEDQILELTPPSKPMNLKSEFCYQTNPASYYYNKITWNHNPEPDMRRAGSKSSFYKRYKIYKVSSPNMTALPDENNYSLLATVDIDENQTPSYVDMSEPSGCNEAPNAMCPPICWTLHAVRYRVVAVDKYEIQSVKSDFASSSAYTISNGGGTQEGDNPVFNAYNEMPKSFSLLQNYPNPFNPSTEIKFELPQNSFVTIKVYNSLGEEVSTLVNNEWKNTGRYSVKFDGINLASGIYFYSIEAGLFKDTKKMILIK